MSKLDGAIVRMNSVFGRGMVTAVVPDADGNGGDVLRRIPITQSCAFLEKRRFRIVGNVVHYLGRKRVLA